MAKLKSLDDVITDLDSSRKSRASFASAMNYLKKKYAPYTKEHELLACSIAKGIENSLNKPVNLSTEGRYDALFYALKTLQKNMVSVYDLERIEARFARARICTIYSGTTPRQPA